ncbi:TetR/AcrR family transcriptional regulator [Brevibacterium spongiae]|uniref:TetR/AcrR family transcriptional regulator n=1 Tax=Brevibacterium spongiae TaxID=2909672 RepID=A0ABY5SLI3_9MICO|nr:TetR/AcrR family transcriptional regulator [Brevibacterium spongiae]UVI35385.1 TetR/AcrR family transcriptional regulator [Brevibacterium spongiae]
MTYHHGDLRRALLAQTASAIAEDGVAKLSMRALAKRAGVSNAAPTYHFGDKAGLLTALAAEGFELLAEAMSRIDDSGLVARGVAYVEFALACPSHFTVMFQPRLLHDDDPELVAARQRAWAALSVGVAVTRSGPDADFGVAAWSLVHGYATLVLSGAVEPEDALSQARAVAAHLVAGSEGSG